MVRKGRENVKKNAEDLGSCMSTATNYMTYAVSTMRVIKLKSNIP